MKVSVKKGYNKRYPVYRTDYSGDEKILPKNIVYRNRHYELLESKVGKQYYDCNGEGYYDKIYCKIPFVLSKTCKNIIYWLLILLYTFIILFPNFILTTKSIIPTIILSLCGGTFMYIFEEWQELKLDKYIFSN